MKYIKYIGKNFKIYINKCKVCDYCVDHCDWGCPKENIENEVVIIFSSKKTHRLACEMNCLLIFYC